MIKTKINKSLNKKTNKQTKKHLLDPKYLSQINSDLHKIFRVPSHKCPKMIEIKNKQLNKQTNQQTNKYFLKLNISAKSSSVFTKLSGKGFPMMNNTNKQNKTKQTNP